MTVVNTRLLVSDSFEMRQRKTQEVILPDLPLDILLGVLRYLTVADILRLRQVRDPHCNHMMYTTERRAC